MITLRNKKTGKYINRTTIPIYYSAGNVVFRFLSIRQQTDKCINNFFDDNCHYYEDMDQLNNHINFVIGSIARAYDSTIDRVFVEFIKNCEILDDTGNIFPIEGNINCGKFRGRIDY
jgi:hypothetical protein